MSQLSVSINITVSPPAREVWIEITFSKYCPTSWLSPPAREVWIEMWNTCRRQTRGVVASREGDMG